MAEHGDVLKTETMGVEKKKRVYLLKRRSIFGRVVRALLVLGGFWILYHIAAPEVMDPKYFYMMSCFSLAALL